MNLDFRTLNTLWASLLVQTLMGLGLKQVVIAPGSRSAPLALACGQAPDLEVIPVLDERSGAFLALGLAKRQQRPVLFVCTSGTAGANAYGAVIEAHYTGVPLIILTADRPPELRNCHAGQAIDQTRLFGIYPRWFEELPLPEAHISTLAHLRQTLIHAWDQSLAPQPGAVHLNCPLRDPLAPLPDGSIQSLATQPAYQHFQQQSQQLLTDRSRLQTQIQGTLLGRSSLGTSPLPPDLQAQERGLIIVGPAQPTDPHAFAQTLATLAHRLKWPVLTDVLNPLRHRASLNPWLISHYDLLLRHPHAYPELMPDLVLQVGELPTSKSLRQWLETLTCPRHILTPPGSPDLGRNFDPLHGLTLHWSGSWDLDPAGEMDNISPVPHNPRGYAQAWLDHDRRIQTHLHTSLQPLELFNEPKLAWFLAQVLPPQTPLFVANSTPVRDLEWFWTKNDRQIQPFFNRGANGIDGTLSTALGMAQGHDRPSVLLTGDLSLLHDTNGFLHQPRFRGHLTIVLINNQGGGIFELLPIAQFDPPFEDLFALPQAVDFSHLCQTYGVSYEKMTNWNHLGDRLKSLPRDGIRVLEIPTDRKKDAAWRKTHLPHLGHPNFTGTKPDQ